MNDIDDCDLLALAAEAAGVKAGHWCEAYDDEGKPYDPPRYGPDIGNDDVWNPLYNDGDALRLAAKLKIDIEWQATQVGAYPDVEAYISNPDGACFCASEPEHDYRYAIVRAAAEAGKVMP